MKRSLARALDQGLFIGLYVEPEDTKNSWVMTGAVATFTKPGLVEHANADAGTQDRALKITHIKNAPVSRRVMFLLDVD